MHCKACDKPSHKSSYTQFFFNTNATALRDAAAGQDPVPPLGKLLRRVDCHQKSCDTDDGMRPSCL